MSSFSFSLCFLLAPILVAQESPGSATQKSLLQAVANAKKMPAIENLATLTVSGDFKVGAASARTGSDDQKTAIFLLRHKENKWVQASYFEYDGAYNPRIEFRHEFLQNGEPLILLRINYGAAIEEIRAFRIIKGKLVQIQSLTAGVFFWSTTSIESKPILVGYPPPIDMKETSYCWNGSRFIEKTESKGKPK